MAGWVGGATHQNDQSLVAQQTDELNRRWADLTSTGEGIKSQLTTLESEWQGDAATAFTEAANTWISGYNQVLDALSVLKSHVATTNEGLSEAETQRTSGNASAWS